MRGQGDWKTHYEEALRLFRGIGDSWGICETLCRLGCESFNQEDFRAAGEAQDEGIRLARQAGDNIILPVLLLLSGCRNWYQGNDRTAERLYLESLEPLQKVRYKAGIGLALYFLGQLTRKHGEDERARGYYEKGVVVSQSNGNIPVIVCCLVGLATLFSAHGQLERGARLFGALDDLAQTQFVGPRLKKRLERIDYERSVSSVRAHLGEDGFAAAFAEGQRMTLDEAVALALG
jgi:hypothetical protein